MERTAANAKLRERRFARARRCFCAHVVLGACLALTAHAQNATYGSVRGGQIGRAHV